MTSFRLLVPYFTSADTCVQTYTNEGYPSLTLTINRTTPSSKSPRPQETLHCVLQYEQYPITMTFQHMSGEFFLLYIRWFSTEARIRPDDFEIGTDMVTKAEFRLGEDGQVKDMGLLVEPEMGEDKIWFKKDGAENSDRSGQCYRADSSAFGAKSSQGVSGAGRQRRLFSRMGQRMAPLFA